MKKPMACLRRPSGTKPNSEEHQPRADTFRRINEDRAPPLKAEGARRYRTVFCNCCMASFQQSTYQIKYLRLFRKRLQALAALSQKRPGLHKKWLAMAKSIRTKAAQSSPEAGRSSAQ